MNQHQVTRGILTEKIKKMMFSTFDRKLQEINRAATYTQVQAWKKSEETTWCYNHLEELIDETDENSSTYMDTIVSRVFPDGSPSYNSTAYVMAVCSLMLDPNHSGITMSDEVTGILMTQYMDLLKENG